MYTSSTENKLMLRSYFEAERNNLPSVIRQAMEPSMFVVAQGSFIDSVKMGQDNMSAIAFVKKGKSATHRIMHFAVRYFFTNKKIDDGVI